MDILVSFINKIHGGVLTPNKYEAAVNLPFFNHNGILTTKERALEILTEFTNTQVSKYDYVNLDVTARFYPHTSIIKRIMTPSEKKALFDEAMTIEEFMEYAYES